MNTSQSFLKLRYYMVVQSLLIAGVVLAGSHEDPFAKNNFNKTIALKTDYVFRGVSFSDEGPAIQGSLDWSYDGFYAGVWASNLEFGDGSIEIDYYAGYASSIGPIDYDIGAAYYQYPSTSKASVGNVEPEQVETMVTLSHTFTNLMFEPDMSVFWAWSPDYALEDGTSHYIRGAVALSLPYGVSVDSGVGHQDVAGGKTTPNGFRYSEWDLGISKEIVGFNLELRYHNTDLGGDNADEHLVFAISCSL